MPKGPDVPPRVLILIAVAAALGLFLVLDPFGGDETPVAPAAPPAVAEQEAKTEPTGSEKEPAETAATPEAKAPEAGGEGGGSADPQEQYLDCVAAADGRKQIRACERKVYGG